jgi:hypothetical protein
MVVTVNGPYVANGLNQLTTAGTTALGDDGREISCGMGSQTVFRVLCGFKNLS